ncbi:MAG: hypothetical protein CV088_18960 [Nitrospira sp. LK70]|nr:hypothetical protein [Nitrospira sp. LK70]
MDKPRYALWQPIITALLVFQAGCGATQLGMCAPHTKEEGAPTRNWAECFDQPFSHGGIIHSVFCLPDGTGKPPLLLLHELTGLSPGTLAYAEELSKDFTVYVPLLFGEKGKFSLTKGLSAYWFRGSMEFFPGGEWGVPSQGSAPIVNWLRGVVQEVGERHALQSIGIIGNCLTGSIPVALLDHPQVAAVVVAQPALPLRLWWYTDADHKSLGISSEDIAHAQRSKAKIFGLRFQSDCISHPDKMNTLRKRFRNRFRFEGAIEYRINGKPAKAHSTLIGSWREQGEAGQPSRDARNKVREFLLEELSEIRPAGKEMMPRFILREGLPLVEITHPRSPEITYGPFLTFPVEAAKHISPGAAQERRSHLTLSGKEPSQWPSYDSFMQPTAPTSVRSLAPQGLRQEI